MLGSEIIQKRRGITNNLAPTIRTAGETKEERNTGAIVINGVQSFPRNPDDQIISKTAIVTTFGSKR